MPKIFRDQDREAIRKSLIEAGREQFRRYGLKRTPVDDLAREAGIAKGTFYHFFESKEDLFLEICDDEEKRLAGRVLEILQSHADARDALKAVMDFSLEFLQQDSLLARLRESGEFGLLSRGVGREKLEKHLENDVGVASTLIAEMRARGATPRVSAEVLAAVLRAVVLLSFHQREIGEALYGSAMELITAAIADRVAEGKG
jgi:AcrR family transcriptional regulator